MIKWITSVWIVLMGILWPGCSGEWEGGDWDTDNGNSAAHQGVALMIAGENHIDSAQVFFLRQLQQTDSFIHREVIYDIGSLPKRFNFNLPAGNYVMILFGNVATERIVFTPPYSGKDISLDYGGGIEPPTLYYGRSVLNVGVDSAKNVGFILVTSWVELTVRNIPQGVSRITVQLQNTSAGLVIGGSYVDQQMTPELSKTVTQLQEGNNYTLSFFCFPNVSRYGGSTLAVQAYDSQENTVYSGTSAEFIPYAGKKMVIACTFEALMPLTGEYTEFCPDDEYKLDWDYDEAIR